MDMKLANSSINVYRRPKLRGVSLTTKIIRVLRDGPATSKFINNQLKGNPRSTSTRLSQMLRDKIITIVETPERLTGKHGVIYKLS